MKMRRFHSSSSLAQTLVRGAQIIALLFEVRDAPRRRVSCRHVRRTLGIARGALGAQLRGKLGHRRAHRIEVDGLLTR
jgi:hypothetical protein